jgi:hypothetical protein
VKFDFDLSNFPADRPTLSLLKKRNPDFRVLIASLPRKAKGPGMDFNPPKPPQVCASCKKEAAKLLYCSRCRGTALKQSPQYCSVECQRLVYHEHKRICGKLHHIDIMRMSAEDNGGAATVFSSDDFVPPAIELPANLPPMNIDQVSSEWVFSSVRSCSINVHQVQKVCKDAANIPGKYIQGILNIYIETCGVPAGEMIPKYFDVYDKPSAFQWRVFQYLQCVMVQLGKGR